MTRAANVCASGQFCLIAPESQHAAHCLFPEVCILTGSGVIYQVFTIGVPITSEGPLGSSSPFLTM